MVEVEWDEGVVILTLKGPSPWNTLDQDTLESLTAAFPKAVAEGARAIVLTGSGKVFSAGGDINRFNSLIQQGEAALAKAIAASMEDLGNPIMRCIAESPVPVVSAVNGPCAGGSLGFALAADIVLCARSAYFLVPQVTQLGIVPDCGVSWGVARALGRPRALGMALLGGRLSGEEAEQWGLVWKCFDDAELMTQARAIAHKLAALPAAAVTACRQLIDQASHVEPSVTLAAERQIQRTLVRSDFFREAVTRFVSRRR